MSFYDDLVEFCSTRPLSIYHDGKKLPEEELLDRIQGQLELEEEYGREGHIVCPHNSQLPSNQRQAKLLAAEANAAKNADGNASEISLQDQISEPEAKSGDGNK